MPRAPLVLVLCGVVAIGSRLDAQIGPYTMSFADDLVAGGFTQPISFAFLPDGRILVAEQQTGVIKLFAAGSSTVVGTIGNLNIDHPHRGLMSIAVDPNWPARPYLYVWRTNLAPQEVRLSMFRINGNLTNPVSHTLSLGAEYVILAGVPDADPYHQGGTLRFDASGRLLLSIGDDNNMCEAQDFASPLGKLLRLDVSALPGSGTGPPPWSTISPNDNPFPNTAGTQPLVWASGLRNPFRFVIDPLTHDIILGDVGQATWEEINLCNAPGMDFGWPRYEADATFSLSCPTAQASLAPPIVSLAHAAGAQVVIPLCCYRNPGPSAPFAFGPEYEGTIFYADYYTGSVRRAVLSEGVWTTPPPAIGQPSADDWAQNMAYVADAQVAPDGALYYVKQFPGSIRRIRGIRPILLNPPVLGTPFQISIYQPEDITLSYACVATLSTAPGIPLPDGRTIPLNPDALTDLTLTPNNGVVTGNLGVIGPTGSAAMTLLIPAFPGLSGLTFYAVYVTNNRFLTFPQSITTVSFPLAITLQ